MYLYFSLAVKKPSGNKKVPVEPEQVASILEARFPLGEFIRANAKFTNVIG